jgi:hypothetical protein
VISDLRDEAHPVEARNDNGETHSRGIAHVLESLLGEFEADWSGNGTARVSLGELFDRMGERAFGLLLLLLALPCCLPFVYGLPQIVSLPMLMLAAQMAAGRPSPWLPESLRRRDFSVAAALDVVRRSRRYLQMAEWFASPRMAFVTGVFASRITGALLLIPAFSIMVPLPLTNTVPGIAVAIVSIGLLERDGLFVIGGMVLGLTWVAALIIGGEAAIMALIHFTHNWAAQ